MQIYNNYKNSIVLSKSLFDPSCSAASSIQITTSNQDEVTLKLFHRKITALHWYGSKHFGMVRYFISSLPFLLTFLQELCLARCSFVRKFINY